MAKNAEKELFPTWVYPLNGDEPRIEQLPEGAKPPKGCSFSPADVKQGQDAK